MTRFSLLYGSRGEPVADSERMRRRLAATLKALKGTHNSELARIIQGELGVRVPFRSHYLWDDFFSGAELRDVLDTVTVFNAFLVDFEGDEVAEEWRSVVARIFAEENVFYRLDDDAVVHFSVDEEFERSRLASLAVLQDLRYANVLASFDRVYQELDQTPPNGKEAIRATFSALEGLFKLMFDRANRLGSEEVQTHLRPYLDQRFAGQMPAIHAAQKLAGAFKEWVAGAHFYRHEQGHEEVVQPPLGLAIATVGAGAAFLRWLAELDQGIT